MALSPYKRQIASVYDERASRYEHTAGNADWHRCIADRLVHDAELQAGQYVLDLATGTGLVAFSAAQTVGSGGMVVGVDIADDMLALAQLKAASQPDLPLTFLNADAEALGLPDNHFDHVLCAAALIWMSDIPTALRHWHQKLKSGGWLGFQTHPESAFVMSRVLQQVAAQHGIDLRFHRPVGTPEKIYQLLAEAGYEAIAIHTETEGHWLTLEDALAFERICAYPAPGQYPHPLSLCSVELRTHIQQDYEAAIIALSTEQGVWNDTTSCFVRARKQIHGRSR